MSASTSTPPSRRWPSNTRPKTNSLPLWWTAATDIVYVAPLRAVPIEKVVAAANDQSLLTLTGVTEYASSGIIVSLGEKGGRPSILVNLAEAKANRVSFAADFLKIAEIVKR